MTRTPDEWDRAVAEEADRITKDAGEDGIERKKIEPQVVEAMRKKIADEKVGAPGIEAAVKKSLDRLDEAREAEVEDLQEISDALADNTILGQNDPRLDQMAVIGTGRGLRKAFRYLTAEDLDNMALYRSTKATERARAAESFLREANRIKVEMRKHNVRLIGDLFTGGGDQ
jgi:hypothetical protein